MTNNSAQLKESIKNLSKEDLEKLVLKTAVKDKSFRDFLWVNYIDKELGEKDLYEKTLADLDVLICKRYKGFSPTIQTANMLAACSKRINEFSKISKNKTLEADLLVYILELAFSDRHDFGTCFTVFDYKVALLLKRLISLVTKKMHEDYLLDYKEKINYYLKTLHTTSDHCDFVYVMPQEL